MWYDDDHLASLLQFNIQLNCMNSKLLFNHWPEAAGQNDTGVNEYYSSSQDALHCCKPMVYRKPRQSLPCIPDTTLGRLPVGQAGTVLSTPCCTVTVRYGISDTVSQIL
jgi:hypothetical protein